MPNADRLYFEFKKLKKSDETIDSFLQDIIKYAKYYQNIKNCDYYDDGYKGSIGRMLYLELGTVVPLLFDIYNAFNENLLDNDDMNEALQIIESYYTRRKFCNFSTSSSNRTFISIGAEIDNYMDEMNVTYLDAIKHSILTRKGKSKFPTDNEFKENFGLYGLYNDKSEFKKYILERFENTNSRERVAVDEQVNNGDLTIEHVMPQTLSADWKKELGDKWDEIFSKYLDTIGNLTLTAYNSDYSNNTFKFKKELPDKGFLCSKLFLNDYIKKCDKWGKDEIENRCKLLFELALKIWPNIDYSEELNIEDHWVDIDDDFDYTNMTIKKVKFNDEEFVTKDITDAYVKINNILYNLDPDKYSKIDNNVLSSDETKLRRGILIGGGIYAEQHMNSQRKISLIRDYLKIYNLDTDNVSFLVGIKNIGDFNPIDESTYKFLKIGQLARELIKYLLENNKLSDEMISKLKGTEYTRATFPKAVYPILANARDDNRNNSKTYRYYQKPINHNGKNIFISSQWFEDARESLIKWFKEQL